MFGEVRVEADNGLTSFTFRVYYDIIIENKTIGDEGITVDFRFIKVPTSN